MAAAGGPWPPMLWVGGAQGAGKSRLSWALAHSQDLPLHPVDLWTYDHVARMPPASSMLADQLARGSEAAADVFEESSRDRLALVLDDVAARGLGPVPALVEGPQLLPGLAGRLPPGCGVWLVPDPGRTRLTRQQRAATENVLAQDQGSRARAERAERLAGRDAILATRIRAAAVRSGRPVIEVAGSPDWPAIAAAVEAVLGPALRAAPRLTPGEELRRQRRFENAAACRQGQLWQQAAVLATLPAYPFACECGASGCQAVWPATPGEYGQRTHGGRPLAVPGHG